MVVSSSSLKYSDDLARKLKEIDSLTELADNLQRAITPDYPFSDSIHDYIVTKYDYARNNPKERKYVDLYKNYVLVLFENRCAACDSTRALDMDHFLLAKSVGGSFCLLHTRGYHINNMIPLCAKCNRSKGKKSYKTICDEERLAQILELNKTITRRVNLDASTNDKHPFHDRRGRALHECSYD